MLRFVRNFIFAAAMFVLTICVAWAIDVESLAFSLPVKWDYELREAAAVSIAIAIGVFTSSVALSFLLHGKRKVWWVSAYGALWSAIALFPGMRWVTPSYGPSGIGLGSVCAWGPLLVMFASLLALRISAFLHRFSLRRVNET